MKKIKVRYSVEGVQQEARSSELPTIKHERRLLLKSLVGQKAVDGAAYFELTLAEFIVISTIQYANLNYLLLFLKISYKYGPMSACGIFVVFQLIFGMPLCMLHLFLSSYTKRSFFMIWECIPIIEGLGYALAIAKLAYEVNNVAVASYCVQMIVDLLQHQPVQLAESCTGLDRDARCVSYGSIANINCTNGSDTPIFIATQYYLRMKLLNYDQFDKNCLTMNTSQLAVFTGLWVFIFIICLFGIQRTVKFLFKSIMVTTSVAFVISLYVLCNAHTFPKSPTVASLPYKTFTFWIELVLHTNSPSTLAQSFWLGTLLPKSFPPRYATLVIVSNRVIICFLILCFSSIVLHGILYNYTFEDPNCLIIHGVDIFVAFVPDILFQLHFGLLMSFIWYFSMIFLAVVNPIFGILSIVDSLCERKPELNSRRLVLYAVFCVLGFLLSVPYSLTISYELLSFYNKKGILLLYAIFLFIVNISLLFLYSITRIIEDYTFTYGKAPHGYWKIFWRMIPIITLYIFILMLSEVSSEEGVNLEDPHDNICHITLCSYIVMTVICFPVILVALMKIFKQLKYRSLKSLLRPTSTWGPYLPEKRNERKLFFPEREIKYRNMSLRCAHNCLVDTDTFSQENMKQMNMLDNLVSKNKDKLDPNFMDFIVSQSYL